MNDFLANIDVYLRAVVETLVIVGVSMVLSGIVGLALGVGLVVTRPGGILANRAVSIALNVLVNVVRPVPFVIFVAAILPLTVAVIGTYIGTAGATFALSLAAAFAVSRVVEQNLVTVDPGVIEAARAMGAGPWRIILTVLIPEGLGPLILGYTFVFVGIVDMSAQVGIVGGGGLGDYAVTSGIQRFNYPVVYITVATIIVLVQVGQFVGNRLARAAFRH